MKKILIFLIALFCCIPTIKAEEKITVHLFYGYSCPHCAKEKEYLSTLKDVNVVLYEVYKDSDNNNLLTQVSKKLDVEIKSVPYTVIGGKVFQGYSDNTKEDIEKTIKFYQTHDYKDLVEEVKDGNMEKSDIEVPIYGTKIKIPLIGEVDPLRSSIPAMAIIIGTVDGFNPCAMWILIFLISMLLGTKDKKRMWTLGITFLVTSAFVYFLFMMAWLKVAISFSQIRWIQILIALIALIGSFINLKGYFKAKESGCEVVDDKKRKGIMKNIKKFTTEKSFILAILGIMTLAFTVNLIELACSAGLPLLFTQVLALNNLSNIQYIIYVLIYILFFLIDDLIVFIVAMKTFEITGISTKYNKYSHLIGGIIMLLIGILMIFKPEWLMFNF